MPGLLRKTDERQSQASPSAVTEIRQRIAAATRLADAAGDLQAEANRAHGDLLDRICRLSDKDADLIETAFTAFEIHLFRVPSSRPVQ